MTDTLRLGVVEDDVDLRFLVEQTMEVEGFDVRVFDPPESILAPDAVTLLDVVLLDYRLGGSVTGLTIAQALRAQRGSDIRIVLWSAAEHEALSAGIAAWVDVILVKPVSVNKLTMALRGESRA